MISIGIVAFCEALVDGIVSECDALVDCIVSMCEALVDGVIGIVRLWLMVSGICEALVDGIVGIGVCEALVMGINRNLIFFFNSTEPTFLKPFLALFYLSVLLLE